MVERDQWLTKLFEQKHPYEVTKEASNHRHDSSKRRKKKARSLFANTMGASMTSTGTGKKEDSAKLTSARYRGA